MKPNGKMMDSASHAHVWTIDEVQHRIQCYCSALQSFLSLLTHVLRVHLCRVGAAELALTHINFISRNNENTVSLILAGETAGSSSQRRKKRRTSFQFKEDLKRVSYEVQLAVTSPGECDDTIKRSETRKRRKQHLHCSHILHPFFVPLCVFCPSLFNS